MEQSNGYMVPYMIRYVNDHARARQAVSPNSITESEFVPITTQKWWTSPIGALPRILATSFAWFVLLICSCTWKL